MYTLEGQLETQTSPELLLGQFGMYHVIDLGIARIENGAITRQTETTRMHGDDAFVASGIEEMKQRGELPYNTEPELIETVEQAEKYLKRNKRSFSVERKKDFDLADELAGQVPSGTELVGGVAKLWQERRYPAAKAYVYAVGKILAEVSFSPDRGWEHTSDRITGTRRTSGLVVPGLRLTSTSSNVQKTNYR